MKEQLKNITEFGLFVGVMDDLDGMVHMTDLSWEENSDKAISTFEKGQSIKVKVLDVDSEKERISLGVKQLEDDPFATGVANISKGDVVTVTISAIDDKGMEVTTPDGATGYIKKNDLSRDRAYQRSDRFCCW